MTRPSLLPYRQAIVKSCRDGRSFRLFFRDRDGLPFRCKCQEKGRFSAAAVTPGRVYGNRPVRIATDIYAGLFRGIPLVILLFIWYFGLPWFNVCLSSFAASALGFSLCSGAYHSEYVRGGLLSVKRGQMLAAESLGFSRVRMIVSIILSQAVRRALPGCGNEIIYLIKYSSLAYMATCIELPGEGKILASNSFRFTEIFLIVGFFYLLMTSFASVILFRVERYLRIPGFEQQGS